VIELDASYEDDNNDNPVYHSLTDLYNNVTREQFSRCFEEWTRRQAKGGIDEIERGSLVIEGDDHRTFKKGVDKGDKENQERAQYGRLSEDALYCILDALSGRIDVGLAKEAVGPVSAFMDIGMVSCY
jgi:hypothetical protein